MENNGGTLVVGLGEVGSALARVLERSGPILKHDIERRDFHQPIAVMHLCLPFRNEGFEEVALTYIERFEPDLTIVNSTVLPGTTRNIARRSGRPVAYSPVRGKHVKMVHDLLHYRKFVAACEPETAERAELHFQQAGMRTVRMARLETLELAKLAETTYFGVIIAFAQELNRYAASVDADYDEATGFFDEIDFLPRTRYFPRFIGGNCVIPNIHLLQRIGHSPLLEAVLDSNRRRAEELQRSAAPENPNRGS